MKFAIVGAGTAGMAAALFLDRAGHALHRGAPRAPRLLPVGEQHAGTGVPVRLEAGPLLRDATMGLACRLPIVRGQMLATLTGTKAGLLWGTLELD